MEFHISTDIWVWIAVFFTLSVYTFLWRDNLFYKFAEAVTVGVGMGFAIVQFWNLVAVAQFWVPFRDKFPGSLVLVIPAVMGLMMLTRIVPKFSWMSRYALAFGMGAGSGFGLPRVIQTGVLQQLYATMLPIDISWQGLGVSLIIIIGVITGLIYFFFSKEHKGVFGGLAKIGIWFLMVGFGATFGYTVMARLSLFIGRVLYVLVDFLGMNLF